MKRDDSRIAHLSNLGRNRDEAIRALEKKMQESPDFLEIAEIAFSHMTRDGGLMHREIAYVAGICGTHEEKKDSNYSDDIYHMVYFCEMVRSKEGIYKPCGTIYSNSLRNIKDYLKR